MSVTCKSLLLFFVVCDLDSSTEMALLLYGLCGFLMENCFSSKKFASGFGFGLDFRLFQLELSFEVRVWIGYCENRQTLKSAVVN